MSIAELLPVPVVIPVVGALLSPIVTHLDRRLPLLVGIFAMAGSGVLLGLAAPTVFAGDGHVVVDYLSAQRPVHGHALGIALAADPFGLTFALLTAGLGLLLLLSLLSEFGHLGPREIGGLSCLTQLLLAALIGAALTADTVNLFVWFEVAALSSYGLTGFFLERPIALEAAFKNCVLTSSAGFAVFIGAGMLYATYGALNFGQLHRSLDGHVGTAAIIALALLVAGFATKAGVMPFHGWLPDAHTPVPGAISALFSGLMVDLGIVALARLALQVYGPDSGRTVLGLLTVLGIVSAILGAALALAQDDLKRLLAWDTVSQMGVLLVGFASATDKGVAGAVFHLVNHGIFKALLFLCAGAVVHSTGKSKLSEMGGLARNRPLVTAAFTVGSIAIAGIPPMNGFASLGLIHEGLEQTEPVIFGLALLAQVITVAALARACYLGFYRRRSEPYEHLERQPWGMRVSLLTLAACCVASGGFAGDIAARIAGPAASILLHPATYAGAVLRGHGAVPHVSVEFSYTTVSDWIITAVEVGLGLALAAGYLRVREPRPITWLRRLHTGSVNDYAAFALSGLAIAAFALLG